MTARLALTVVAAAFVLSLGLTAPAAAGEGCGASKAAAVTAENTSTDPDASQQAAPCAHACTHHHEAADGSQVACACTANEKAAPAEVAQTDKPKN